jgi:hypothetical protein
MRSDVTLTLALVLLTACSTSQDNKHKEWFVGSWTATDGQLTMNCPGENAVVIPANGITTWVIGQKSDIQQSDGCLLTAQIDGKTATAAANQTCTQNSGTSKITSYTFTVNPDSATATEKSSGSIAKTDTASGQNVDCPFTEEASYKKQ